MENLIIKQIAITLVYEGEERTMYIPSETGNPTKPGYTAKRASKKAKKDAAKASTRIWKEEEIEAQEAKEQ